MITQIIARDEHSTQDEHSAIVNKYAEIDDKLFMSIDEAIELSHEIARRISMGGVKPHGIVGIANGALLPTKIIATDLNLPFEMIIIRRKGSVIKSWLSRYKAVVRLAAIWYKVPLFKFPLVWVMQMMSGLKPEPALASTNYYQDQHILLIDDAIDTGKTLRRAEQILGRQQCRQITTAVISASKNNKKSTDLYIPDYFISRRIQHFPWSVNHPDFPKYQKWLKRNGLETNQ
jgi:hypoxanthine phosphoribosyltransferase